MKKNNHVFGPVPSRRLGRSLGIDLVPFKTCSYDCIYCQLGKTTDKTINRKEYVPVKSILEEITGKLQAPPWPEYITLSGSGEPTLYCELYSLIKEIKYLTKIPVAVLTNGSLLWDKDIQRGVRCADLVIPSLDAGNENEFQCVNKPHHTLTFQKMITGLIDFRQCYTGVLWLEVFLLEGITSLDGSVEKIAAYADKINPDKIQLNTVARPPAEDFASAVAKEKINTLSRMFGDKAEVIADYNNIHNSDTFSVSREEVFTLLKRRPCSLGDIASGLSIHRNEAVKHIQHLINQGVITTYKIDNTVFYKTK